MHSCATVLAVAVGAAACDYEQPPPAVAYALDTPTGQREAPDQPDRFAEQLSSVELEQTQLGLELRAVDDAGEVIGVLALSSQPNGAGGYQLSAEYDDGYADYTVARGGEFAAEQTLSDETVTRRAALILGALDVEAPPQSTTALECALTIAAAGVACGISPPPAKVLTCPAGIIKAICGCRDQIKDTTGFDFSVCDEL